MMKLSEKEIRPGHAIVLALMVMAVLVWLLSL